MTNSLRKAVTALVTVATASVALVSKVAAQSYYTTTSGEYIPLTDAQAGGVIFGSWAVTLCCCCLLLLIPLGMAIYVYKDAEKNKIENAVIWALLTFFTNIIGLLIYLLAIKPEAIKKSGGTPSTPTAM